MKVQLIDSNSKYAYVITESNDRLKVALYKDEVGIYFVNEMLKKTYVIKNDELVVEDYSYFEGLENDAKAVQMPFHQMEAEALEAINQTWIMGKDKWREV